MVLPDPKVLRVPARGTHVRTIRLQAININTTPPTNASASSVEEVVTHTVAIVHEMSLDNEKTLL